MLIISPCSEKRSEKYRSPNAGVELDIEVRYKISFWDALIVQAAGSCGAEVIYSEDLADGQRYGDVRVINPLK
jgi:predicted nucleic acid-binding protein